MRYPDDFETRAFPAGRNIAIARAMAIGCGCVFVLILFVCLFIVVSVRSGRIAPFLISVNDITGEWGLIQMDNGPATISAHYALQESVVANFAQRWFDASGDMATNNDLWARCDRKDCGTGYAAMYNTSRCAVYCATADEVYDNFVTNIVPIYKQNVEHGVYWNLDRNSIHIVPVGTTATAVAKNGGTWRLFARVNTNVGVTMKVIAYVRVARDTTNYPRSVGYYVADFNTYRVE